ncbi:TetR/AcrR family transcriptional regulator [Sandaracinus amylolyticus]|uniref:TetR/AcrR family transcriptional regulator n=1 Tax=Sandaracinus amylolyticus TaxID=927083 RepID=UPI001F2E9668|nr:TetR/AcrR family transcriptional regulator [Sandaracinus amylolyticus]UJR79713.1 Transcriptional regulator [Sandaracinus amylolyticus]
MARRPDTTPRKRPLQRRAQDTVDAILDATAHILVRDGYDALSTNRVAERAGVSIGSLYQYFPNKESLVGELVDRHSAFLFQMVVDTFAAMSDHAPRTVAGALVSAMIASKRERPKLAKVLREQIPRTGRLARYEQELDRVIEITKAYLDAHHALLRVEDTRLAAFVSVHMVDALTHAVTTQRRETDDDEMVRTITDVVTRYLLKD